MIRIANGQGFWGDSLEAPVEQVRRGPIDYLTLDYLAEVTMSILQKQRSRDPKAGYARDFVDMIARVLPDLVDRRIRVIANAGGVNPAACRDAVLEVAKRQGIEIKVATVAGDDIMGRLDDFIARGVELKNMETGEPLSAIRAQVQSANVYFGAFPVAEALAQGAQIVITGRVHRYRPGARADDSRIWMEGRRLGQARRGNHRRPHRGMRRAMHRRKLPGGLGNHPEPGRHRLSDHRSRARRHFRITKHAGTGGRVTVASVKEQLLYEMGDPREYITPDCIADFTTIHLEQAGPDRVRFSGIRGRPATEFYKVSISYSAGFKAIGTLVYAWPDAYKKARAADKILRQRLDRLGLRFDAIRTEFLGANACHGIAAAEPSPEIEPQLAEVVLRFGVRSNDRAAVERFTREIRAAGAERSAGGDRSGQRAAAEWKKSWRTGRR